MGLQLLERRAFFTFAHPQSRNGEFQAGLREARHESVPRVSACCAIEQVLFLARPQSEIVLPFSLDETITE